MFLLIRFNYDQKTSSLEATISPQGGHTRAPAPAPAQPNHYATTSLLTRQQSPDPDNRMRGGRAQHWVLYSLMFSLRHAIKNNCPRYLLSILVGASTCIVDIVRNINQYITYANYKFKSTNIYKNVFIKIQKSNDLHSLVGGRAFLQAMGILSALAQLRQNYILNIFVFICSVLQYTE